MPRTNRVSVRLEPLIHAMMRTRAADLKMTESAFLRALVVKHLEHTGYITREQLYACLDGELEKVS